MTMALPSTHNAPAPRRLRFSLRGFLVGIGAVCLLLSNGIALRELSELRRESQQLRDELGYLTITDASKPHVASASRMEDLTWRWRIYVPDRRRFAVYVDEGMPIHNRVYVTSGENSLDAAVYLAPEGNWQFKMIAANPSEGASYGYSGALKSPLADRIRQSGLNQAPGRGTVAFDSRERFLLLYENVPEATLFGGDVDRDRPGFRVWMEDATLAD
jgi:hypothetical protein